MPWLLDGNNLARGGDRDSVRRAALAVARHERVRILIFFDGEPPPGVGVAERLGQVEVRYAAHADTAIVAFLRASGRGWRVATDDRALGLAIRASGAEAVPAARFWEKATAARAAGPEAVSRSGVAEEMAYFADAGNKLPRGPTRLVRKRRARPRRPKGLQ